MRGPNVMQGYYHRPEETAQALDAEGWLHTGDVGEIDAEGFIAITGRKKDLIITSEGENIAPQHIEGLLKHDPLIEEACLIGDKRPYLTVLLVPNRPLLEALAHKSAHDRLSQPRAGRPIPPYVREQDLDSRKAQDEALIKPPTGIGRQRKAVANAL